MLFALQLHNKCERTSPAESAALDGKRDWQCGLATPNVPDSREASPVYMFLRQSNCNSLKQDKHVGLFKGLGGGKHHHEQLAYRWVTARALLAAMSRMLTRSCNHREHIRDT